MKWNRIEEQVPSAKGPWLVYYPEMEQQMSVVWWDESRSDFTADESLEDELWDGGTHWGAVPNPEESIDHEALLAKYIQHVDSWSTGWHFFGAGYYDYTVTSDDGTVHRVIADEFTREQWAELYRLAGKHD